MQYTGVMKRAGQVAWRYRALWFFGAFLALTTATLLPPWLGWDHEGEVTRIPVRITRWTTIYLPGEGLKIDLTVPRGFLIETADGRWTSFRDLFRDVGPIDWPRDAWIVLGVLGGVLVVSALLSAVVSYASETALIRMVSETEDTGEALGVRQGLRRGFSRQAWRIFLIDLALRIPAALALILLLALALSPFLLWLTGSEAAGVAGSVFSTGLLVLFVITALAAGALLSLVVPLSRRACAVEGLGVRASIRRAMGLVRSSFGNVAAIWCTWIGVRVLWGVALVVVLVVLSPLLLLALALGAVAGGIVALPVGGLLSLFWAGASPWVVAAIVGLPILVVVTLAPVAFVRGMVEVLLSGMWTLAYRALRLPPRQAEPKEETA